MRAITLWQPWASLIAEGIKTIETRPKQHPWRSAIGETIAVHASARKPNRVTLGEWHCDPRYRVDPYAPYEPRIWRSLTQPGDLFGTHESRVLPLGAVVATCRLVDVVPIDGLFWATPESPVGRDPRGWFQRVGDSYFAAEYQRPFGDFAPGRWALLLENVQKLAHPVPCRGYQGLWTLPREIEVTAGLMVG